MTRDTIIEFPETSVGYIAGDRERPIHEQAPVAFRTLEASLPTLRGRRFLAALVGPEYRACVAVHAEEDSVGATLSRWVIPGGDMRGARFAITIRKSRLSGRISQRCDAARITTRRVPASRCIGRNTTCMSWCPCAELVAVQEKRK
jgi:hypothetical protein